MIAPFGRYVGWFAAVCVAGLGSTARCQTPLLAHFAEEPADTLIRHLEPTSTLGAGLPTSPKRRAGSGDPRTAEGSGDPRTAAGETNGLIATDPTSGLVATRRRRWLPECEALLLETTLANRGSRPAKVQRIALADWTFRLRDAQDQGYQKLTYRDDVWYGSTFWAGPDWTRVGKNWHHPGENTPSVRRFTAPSDGRVTITGRVFKLHTDGDGVRLAIRHGEKTVWQAEIEGKDASGVEPNVELNVKAGDAIRFVVHKRGHIFCDTTGWDPLITYEDGRKFQASESFSTTRQGLGGWSYEMEAEGQPELGLPRVHSFGPDFALRDSAVHVDAPVAMSGRDSLPIAILADGVDQSGVLLAMSGDGPWQFRATLNGKGRLHVELTTELGAGLPTSPNRRAGSGDPHTTSDAEALTLAPGESIELPRVLLGSYLGQWLAGTGKLQRLLSDRSTDATPTLGEGLMTSPNVRGRETRAQRGLLSDSSTDAAVASLRSQVAGALTHAGSLPGEPPELDLWLMLQAEWHQEDKLAETAESYAAAIAGHLEKARRLLGDLRDEHGPDFLAEEAAQLAELAGEAGRADRDLEKCRSLYQRVRFLKRHIALANPLMDFGKLVFAKRAPTSYSHLVMQYYGWRARPGGGLFVLDRPGYSLACRDILGGRLSKGCVLEPRLSYDAKRIVFSFVECEGKAFNWAEIENDVDEGFYHVYEVNVDGAGLKQLTSGPYDDLMPTYLPDGGIAFSSTRRRGYSRCFGGQFSRRWHVYTLHRIDADGTNLQTLSYHDTNEWFPAVSNTGLILYARWDYIDRDAVTHQNLWATRPDGTNAVALWGNATASPNCTFQLQPIPNSPKVVFTASAHHSVAGGSIAVVDPTVSDNGQEAITRITPEIPFPEAESRDIREYYTAPWPLSEKYFLVAYSPTPLVWEPGANKRNALGLYLLDVWGNRELIYRDPEIGSTNPCPLVPRAKPPVLPSTLPPKATPEGEMILANVYEGLGDVERGRIKQLRVVQLFPKTTNVANVPPIGLAREENGRAILGTVPVEPDGSARFFVPAGKPLFFQALDEDGFAYQTMRTVSYVQPGERVSCVGCHEHRRTAPIRKDLDMMALRRAPSRIDPGELGGRPFSYVEVVQPVLDRHCVRCHGGEKADGGIDLTGVPLEGFTRSYVSLLDDTDFWHVGTNPENAAKALVPRFGGRNQIQVTPPGGAYGALGSRLMKLLRAGHEDVQLAPEELRRLAAWIDLNAIFYGVNLAADQARQLRGEIVAMPEIQ